MARRLRRTRLVALAAVAGLGLAACGGSDIKEDDTASGGGSDCGDLRIAVNPWTGYVSNAHVIGVVAQEELGCNVTYPDVKEEDRGTAELFIAKQRNGRTGVVNLAFLREHTRFENLSRRPE